jgi:hypothetical protein
MITKFFYNATEGEGGGAPVVERMTWAELSERFPEESPAETPNDTTNTTPEEIAAPQGSEQVETPQQTGSSPSAADPIAAQTTVDTPLEQPALQEKTAPAPISWQDSIKEVDPSEVLRQVGLSDEMIGLLNHYQTHGNLDAYYEAKVKNWDTVPAEDLLRQQLRSEYAGVSDDDFEILFQEEINSRYKLAEHYTDEERRVAGIRLQNDANKVRAGLKAEQAKFQVPVKDMTAAQREAAEAQARQAQAQEAQLRQAAENIKQSPAIQKLQQERKVSVKAGDAMLNLNVDPQAILDATLNVNKIFEGAVDEKGQPTTAWIERLAFFLNPDAFKKALIDQGKSLGAKEEITPLVNPSSGQPRPAEAKTLTLAQAFAQNSRQVSGSDFFKS